jgi:hypothetical protein
LGSDRCVRKETNRALIAYETNLAGDRREIAARIADRYSII